MEELHRYIEDLDAEFDFYTEELTHIKTELLETKEKFMKLYMKTVNGQKHVKKLKLLKRNIKIGDNIEFAFRKNDAPYYNDNHEVIPDPLDWKISKINMINIINKREILFEVVFYYHNPVVKTFVTEWMLKNLKKSKEINENQIGWELVYDIYP